ncbi:Zinc finger protein, partial [Plecturocebus cupreus]
MMAIQVMVVLDVREQRDKKDSLEKVDLRYRVLPNVSGIGYSYLRIEDKKIGVRHGGSCLTSQHSGSLNRQTASAQQFETSPGNMTCELIQYVRDRSLIRPGVMAPTCNSSILGGQSRQITRSRDQDHPGQMLADTGLALSHRLIIAHCSLDLLGSSDPSTSRVAGATGTCNHARLVFVFFVEPGFCHIAQAGLELLGSSDPLASASQSAGITDKGLFLGAVKLKFRLKNTKEPSFGRARRLMPGIPALWEAE